MGSLGSERLHQINPKIWDVVFIPLVLRIFFHTSVLRLDSIFSMVLFDFQCFEEQNTLSIHIHLQILYF